MINSGSSDHLTAALLRHTSMVSASTVEHFHCILNVLYREVVEAKNDNTLSTFVSFFVQYCMQQKITV